MEYIPLALPLVFIYTINGKRDKSKIAEHSWDQKHRFQWDKTSIISKDY